MRRIRLRADSALHVAGTQLAVVNDDVGVHAMDSVTLSHAHHLVASALAEWVEPPAPAPEPASTAAEHIREVVHALEDVVERELPAPPASAAPVRIVGR